MIHTFGTTVAYANTAPKSKLDPRSFRGMFCGVNDNESTYRIYNFDERRMISSRDVRFLRDSEFPFVNQPQQPPSVEEFETVIFIIDDDDQPAVPAQGVTQPVIDHAPEEEAIPQVPSDNLISTTSSTTRSVNSPSTSHSPTSTSSSSSQTTRPRATTGPERFSSGERKNDRAFWKNTNSLAEKRKVRALVTQVQDPSSYREAINSSEAHHWENAMQAEMKSLAEMQTWEVVNRPTDRSVVGCRWCFKAKTDDAGNVQRYKARVVAKGYSQIEGVDYTDTFAPVLRNESLRFLISNAAAHKLNLHHLDVDSAFLNGDLSEEVFMELPEGYPNRTTNVAHLKKSIYGLKQAARIWNHKFVSFLKSLGFTQSSADPCMFIRTYENGERAFLGLVVDDMVMAGKPEQIAEWKTALMSEFKMKDLGPLSHFIGVKVSRNADSIALSQRKYVENILSVFGMSDCKSLPTPLPNTADLDNHYTAEDDYKAFGDRALYQRAIGSLIYLSNLTRPDICFSVNFLARKMAAPTNADWKLVQHLFRYLRGTADYALTYSAHPQRLQGYSDASYGENSPDRKSTSGYVFILNGGAISWSSRKQDIVTLSSTESEYVALTDSFKEGLWLRGLMRDLTGRSIPVPIAEDNDSTIKLASNPTWSRRTKHIDVRYHFVREVVSLGSVSLFYCPTREMVADIMTKSLGSNLLRDHRRAMGLIAMD
jgi:hypothetical protein